MSRNDMEIIKRKKARGALLGLLDENYPTGVAYVVMERMLVDTGKAQAHELPGIIAYLVDKEYITVTILEEPELKPLMNGILTLRAHGKDLLENSIPDDPGIIT